MLIFMLIFAALLVLCPLALSRRLLVRRYMLPCQKCSMPARFAVIADLHSSLYGEGQAALIEAVRKEAPDAVFLVGDIVDDRRPEEPAWMLLQALAAEFPCYYISGNHEYRSGYCDAIKQTISGFGVTVLAGQCATLTLANGQAFCIAGVDDPAFWGGYSTYGGYPVPQEWSAQLEFCASVAQRTSACSILLSHRPELYAPYCSSGFDFIFSGHAHGGQVRIPGIVNGLFAPCQGWFPKYAGGSYALGETTLIVSRGLCRNHLPRVFNRPELVLVTIAPKNML